MIFALLLLLFLKPPGEYLVLRVNGIVMVKGRSEKLALGQRIKDNDSIRFLSGGSSVTIISPEKGRMILSSTVDGRKGSTRSGELFQEVKNSLLPGKVHIIMAGRDGVIADEAQFASWLAIAAPKDTALLVIDSMRIMLGSKFRDESKTHFFLLKYYHRGQTINKRLSAFVQPDGLFYLQLDKNIFTIDGKSAGISSVSSLEWFYYDSAEESALPLGKTSLTLLTSKSIAREVCLLREQLSGKTDGSSLNTEIYSYLKDTFGNTSRSTINRLNSSIRCQ